MLKELEAYKNKDHLKIIDDLLNKAKSEFFVFEKIDIDLKKELKNISEYIRAKLKDGVIILYSDINSVFYLAVVSEAVRTKLKAKDLVKHISSLTGGKGGGRDDYAQGGGADIKLLSNLKNDILKFINKKIGE